MWIAGIAAVAAVLILVVWRWNARTGGEDVDVVSSQISVAEPESVLPVSEVSEQEISAAEMVPEPVLDVGEKLIYTDEDGKYEVFLCVDNNGASPPQGNWELTIPEGAAGYIPSILVVNQDGFRARDEFLEKVERYSVEAVPKSNYTAMEITEPGIDYEMPSAALVCWVEVSTDCGTNDIVWTLEMKNGDILKLKHTITILAPKTMDIYPEDEPMNTVEELQSLLDRLDQVAGPDTIVNIYLPEVTYYGELQISRHSANLLGALDEDGNPATTFEGAIRVSTQQPDLTAILNIRLIGPGSGTGLSASAGVQLDGCYFTGWAVAAISNQGGWIGAHDCTFEDNGVGLKFRTSDHSHMDAGYIFNTFTGNDVAVQIEETGCDAELMFDQSHFSGNGIDIDNQIDHPVDVSGAIME